MVGQEDLDRIVKDYVNEEGNVTVGDVEDDLRDEDFDDFDSFDKIKDQVAGATNVAANENTINQAQQQAIDSLGDGGAVGGELVRGEGGKTIGAPGNVTQRIERIDSDTGKVIAENKNTGTSGKIGEVELAAPEPDYE